ncbi:hypothetical protein HMPREF1154_2411 [Capnocytophaga sp. CM59]|nr:hypothetical protein HMPREF1154_2411 [Capnocytophaga sp. CM59]
MRTILTIRKILYATFCSFFVFFLSGKKIVRNLAQKYNKK